MSFALETMEFGECEKSSDYMAWDEIDRASDAWWTSAGLPGSAYDEFRGKYLRLPEWFDVTINPTSPEYLAQQDRLWQMMVGDQAGYQPSTDEQSGVDQSIALVRPGLYSDTVERAGDHLIAMGHILKHSGLKPGDRVLEYGAGYGQIALALARMGMIVDTVDIDPGFCSAVQKQADWFQVSLKSHHGEFGHNPSGDQYAMILFYEAFHHARNFVELVPLLREVLQPGGKIVMAGEPINPRSDSEFAKSCPYPWGIRLEAEVAAIVRKRRWYELGFQEEFIFDFFDSMGFTPSKYPGQISHYATVCTFELRPALTKLGSWEAPSEIAESWHGAEPDGQWTKSKSCFPAEPSGEWSFVRVTCANYHPRPQVVQVELGDIKEKTLISPGEEKDVCLRRSAGKFLAITCEPIQPISYGVPDERDLGIFVKEIEFSTSGAGTEAVLPG